MSVHHVKGNLAATPISAKEAYEAKEDVKKGVRVGGVHAYGPFRGLPEVPSSEPHSVARPVVIMKRTDSCA